MLFQWINADDGISNSHAIKIISSDFCLVGLGSIGGQVRSNTNLPLGDLLYNCLTP
ncbi:MAG: hypothetical protein IPG79_19665 [Saprospiraceae bacterium]|nr:hypothetical protein [Saprospiraceae bacterium]